MSTIPTRIIKDGPLDPDIPIIELHPTGLETFMKCAYRFKFDSPPKSAQEIFYEGDISEQLLTNYLYGEKLGDEWLAHFGKAKEFPNYTRLKAHAENLKKKLSEEERKDKYPLFVQKRMRVRIIYAPYEIHLVGTADRIFNDYHVGDCKTSKQKRSEKSLDMKLQRRLYPWMLRFISGVHVHDTLKSDEFSFTYFIFTKQVTPQLQILQPSAKYSEVESLLEYLIIKYIEAYESDVRAPNKTRECRFCSLKDICPIWKREDVEEERF